jgi:NitT/TauT family transport system ATP-binding protein
VTTHSAAAPVPPVSAEMREPLVVVDRVSKRYGTRNGIIPALDDVSFEVREREFLSVVGPSGCGKSTLLMLMAGLIRPSAGQIRVGAHTVNRPYTNLGIVFQRDVLLNWRTVLDNVLLQIELRRLARRRYEDRARELLALVGLEGFEKKYPYELSGGMRQRTAICRALVHDPSLLLMDEPFGALDALTRDQMNLDFLRIWSHSRKTVFFITHSISEAVFLSDRVLVMSPRPGRLVEVLSIALPRPRHLSMCETPEFTTYARQIREALQRQGVLVERQEREEVP